MGGELLKGNSPVQQWYEAVEFEGTMEEGRLLAIRWALQKTWKAKCLDIYCCLDDKTLTGKLCSNSSFNSSYGVLADDIYALSSLFSRCIFMFSSSLVSSSVALAKGGCRGEIVCYFPD
ncbi:26S proteasome alpha-type subunit C9 [Striga asiatica]|uniref:26S proteasome alpha-type subunit C9 n=1 Tax=Striga asiatica TaxID=4170 RepID=A0A5A7Q3A2_STRAF|nr:26S proteasome alpha-type subunit C9 [Striga asiatica]